MESSSKAVVEVTEASKTIELDVANCTCSRVTVFRDRAEVTRELNAALKSGTTELKVNNIAMTLDEGTVRVSGGVGGQKVTILEVVVVPLDEDDHKDADQPTDDEKKAQEKRIEELEQQLATLQASMNRVATEKTWLIDYANENKKLVRDVPRMSTTDAASFMLFYSQQMERIDQSSQKLATQISDLKKELEKEKKKFDRTEDRAKKRSRSVSVLVHTAADCNVTLELAYVVNGASWSPSYDARIDHNSKSLQLIYYGKIVNNTDDDWIDTHLSLSTAEPAQGGNPPKLTTLRVTSFSESIIMSRSRNYDSIMTNQLYEPSRAADMMHQAIGPLAGGPLMQTYMESMPAPPVEVLTSNVDKTATVSLFAIPRAATIKSDRKPHKVTIGIADLQSAFTYTVVPQKTNSSFLRCKAFNTTNFVFLAGPVNVFLGNSFVTVSEIKKVVNSKDSFSLFCGVDASIYVDFKERVFNEKKGLITTSNKQTVKQTITIKNSKDLEVEVSCYSQVPLSSDQKIKVQIVSPNLTNNPMVKLNDFNNLHFNFKFQKTQVLEVEYTIEYPANQKLNFN